MKKLLLLITLISLPSYAAVSANVSIASDYIWRGMTQTDGIAVSGGFDYAAECGFYAGLWGSNVNFNDSTGIEKDDFNNVIESLAAKSQAKKDLSLSNS